MASPRRLRQRLAMPVRALEAAEVRPIAGTDAADEKGHGCRLCLYRYAQAEGHQHQGYYEGETHRVVHVSPPVEHSVSYGTRDCGCRPARRETGTAGAVRDWWGPSAMHRGPPP